MKIFFYYTKSKQFKFCFIFVNSQRTKTKKRKRKTLERCVFFILSVFTHRSRHRHPIKFFLNLTPCGSHTQILKLQIFWIKTRFQIHFDLKILSNQKVPSSGFNGDRSTYASSIRGLTVPLSLRRESSGAGLFIQLFKPV